MKTRIFHTRFFDDPYILSLTFEEKFFYLYLFENSFVGLTGLYEISNSTIQLQTGLTPERIIELRKKLIRDKKIKIYKNWVFLVNSLRYQNYSGPKNKIAYDNELKSIPSDTLSILYPYPIDTLSIGYPELKPVRDTPIKQKQETINNNTKIIKENIKENKDKYKDIREEENSIIIKGNGELRLTLTKRQIGQIARDYAVPEAFVLSKIDDVINYCNKTGNKYQNYYSVVRDWVKKDAIQLRKEAVHGSNIGIVK